MEKNKLEMNSLFVFLTGISLLTFLVFLPFFPVIVLAAVLAVLVWPVYEKLTRIFPRGNSLVAGGVVILGLIFIIAPLLGLGVLIFQDSQGLVTSFATGQSHYISVLQKTVETPVQHFFPNFTFNVSQYIDRAALFVSSNLAGLISGTAYIVFQTFFLLFAFFFMLRDGQSIVKSIVELSPFESEHTEKIIASTKATINSVIKGTLFVGLIRWILLAGSLYVAGIPNPMLWGSLGAIIAAVPGLGTPFAIVPAVIVLILGHHIAQGILLGIFGILTIFLVDNILTTYFFGKGLDVSPLFILFSIFGGLIFFGPLGFIFGPIVLSLFISVINVYKIIVLKQK